MSTLRKSGIITDHCPRAVLVCVLAIFGGVWTTDGAVAQDAVSEGASAVRQHPRPGKLNYYRPGVWSTQTVDLYNRSAESMDVITGGYFQGDSLNRYARRVSLPPESMRRVTFPVLPVVGDDSKITWHPMLYGTEDTSGALFRATDNYMIDAEFLQQPEEKVTIALSDQSAATQREWHLLSEFAVTARLHQGLTRRLVEMDADDLPVDPSGLNVADEIFLGSNRIADDPARLAILRNWVEQGGHLWVRLDFVDPATVRQLLGDSLSVAVVDRCRRNTFQLRNTRVDRLVGEPLEFDYPVDFVRVIVDSSAVEMIHTLDGWPASFIATVGRGRVAFTTLGDRAWLQKRTGSVYRTDRDSLFESNQAFTEVLDEWIKPTDPVPLQPSSFEPLLSAQVAYQIPGRTIILSVLSAFCGCLVVAGWWLQRSKAPEPDELTGDSAQGGRRLERLAVIGPVLALLAALPIVFLGHASRRDVPASMNVAEFVEVSPASSSLRSQGSIAVFAPDTAEVDLQGDNGRILTPVKERMTGTLRQMIRTNFSESLWDRLQINSGLQFLQTHQTTELSDSVRALAAFGPDGVTGTLDAGPFTDPQDVLIAGPAPDVVAVRMTDSQKFAAGVESALPRDVYIPGTVLNDEQVRRQQVFRQLFAPASDSVYPRQPTLLAWMKSGRTDFRSPEEYQRTDYSLVAIPIEFRRTPPGTDVVIPSPFLGAEEVPSAGGGRSTVYDNRSRTWRSGQQPGVTLLKFRLPDSVKPLQLSEVKLEFKLLAPNRNVVFSAGSQENLTQVASVTDAAGTFSFTLTEPEQLQLDPNGNYFVEISVEASEEAEQSGLPNQVWQMDYIRLEMSGRTIEPVGIESATKETTDE